MNKDQTKRIGATNDGDVILEHPVFTNEFIQKSKDGDYDAPSKPKVYDFAQDFNAIEKKKKIADSLNCFDKSDEELISANQA